MKPITSDLLLISGRLAFWIPIFASHRYGVESTEPFLLANYMPQNHTRKQLKDALSTSFDERGLNLRKRFCNKYR